MTPQRFGPSCGSHPTRSLSLRRQRQPKATGPASGARTSSLITSTISTRPGPFKIEPDYDKEKIVALSHDVAETYVPVNITVAYAGQTPVPKPFLTILEWVRTQQGWRMATDIALPIPPAPKP